MTLVVWHMICRRLYITASPHWWLTCLTTARTYVIIYDAPVKCKMYLCKKNVVLLGMITSHGQTGRRHVFPPVTLYLSLWCCLRSHASKQLVHDTAASHLIIFRVTFKNPLPNLGFRTIKVEKCCFRDTFVFYVHVFIEYSSMRPSRL